MIQTNGKPFTDVVGELENGYLLKELTEKIYELTNAVRETRKPGALKLSLKLNPTGRGSIEVDASFDAKVPEHDRPSTTFFMTHDGTLMRNDPNQPNLPLRAVEVEENEPVKVGE